MTQRREYTRFTFGHAMLLAVAVVLGLVYALWFSPWSGIVYTRVLEFPASDEVDVLLSDNCWVESSGVQDRPLCRGEWRGLPRSLDDRTPSNTRPPDSARAAGNGPDVALPRDGERRDRSERLAKAFEYRLNAYRANSTALVTNMRTQGLIVLLSILLMLRRAGDPELFGVRIPTDWLHVVAPVSLMVLWLQFGFLLDEAIEGRKIAWHIVAAQETDLLAGESAVTLLYDAGLLDPWFRFFVPGHDSLGQESFGLTVFFLVAVYGTLLATSHASVLTLTYVGALRAPAGSALRWCCRVLGWVCFGVLIASHFLFAFGGGNPNWLQPVIAALTVGFVYGLLYMAKDVQPTKLLLDRPLALPLRWVLRAAAVWAPPRRAVSDDPRSRLEQLGAAVRGHAGQEIADTLRGRAFERSLPTVALIGDSLSTSFHVSSRPRMLLRVLAANEKNWFVGSGRGSPAIGSLFERLDCRFPLVAVQHASPGAAVNSGEPASFVDVVMGTRDFSRQVSDVLGEERFPDLILVWIGHNNIDWVQRMAVDDWRDLDASLDRQADEFVEAYREQLGRLVSRARGEHHPTAIVVYGLVNFRAFFVARSAMERERAANGSSFPYLERDYDMFASMLPRHRERMIDLADRCNERLKKLVSDQRFALKEHGHVLVDYSDALARVDISNPELIHSADAWHPSRLGHGALAAAACSGLSAASAHLGWPADAFADAVPSTTGLET